jgi:hypothetical protein
MAGGRRGPHGEGAHMQGSSFRQAPFPLPSRAPRTNYTRLPTPRIGMARKTRAVLRGAAGRGSCPTGLDRLSSAAASDEAAWSSGSAVRRWRIVTSTRRFSARPASFTFEAIGSSRRGRRASVARGRRARGAPRKSPRHGRGSDRRKPLPWVMRWAWSCFRLGYVLRVYSSALATGSLPHPLGLQFASLAPPTLRT